MQKALHSAIDIVGIKDVTAGDSQESLGVEGLSDAYGKSRLLTLDL